MTPDVSTALVVAALGLILLSRLLRWTRRSVRRLGIDPLRPALLVAGALLAAGLILAISLSYSTKLPVVRAQSSETVLLPHKSTWSYFYDGVPSTATTGVAPFTMNPCGAAGTAWDPSKSHIEMNGTFRVEGAPQTVKVRVRTAGADPGSPLPNQVQIWVNNALIADYPQPNGECDTEWNNEITVNSALLSRGPNTIRVKTGRFPGTFTRRAVDIEVVAASVDPAPADASFGTDLLRQGLSTDPVNTLTGNFTYQRADIVIPGRGGGVSFSRSYNALDTRISTLGPAWTHAYNTRLETSAETGWPSGTARVVHWDGRTDRYTPNGTGGYVGPAGRLDQLQHFSPAQSDGTVWLVTRPDYSKVRFDTNGRLIKAEDRNGNVTTLTYDSGTGWLSTVGDPAGRGSLTFSYDGSGRITSISDWAIPPRTVQYAYDGPHPNGRLWKVWDRENNLTTFEYQTGTNRLTKIIDANNHTAVENSYDSNGKVVWQKDAKGNQTDFTYAADKTTQTLPTSSFGASFRPTIEHYYDGLGRLTKVTTAPSSGESITQEYTYDAAWNRVAVKDGRGNTTNFCYDSFNQVVRTIGPAPTPTGVRPIGVFEYGSASSGLQHELVKATVPKGVALTNSGDDPTNCFVPLTFNSQGLYQTVYTYDAQHNPTTTSRKYVDPDTSSIVTASSTVEYSTSQPGLVSYTTPPRGNTGSGPDHTYATSFTYFGSGTKNGLLQTVTDPLGNVTRFDYDDVGRRIRMVDPTGSGITDDAHAWLYEYDKENRLTFARTPAPMSSGSRLVTESRYDAVGNLATLIDANGQVTRYLYDERDSLSEVWESPATWTDPATTPDPKYVTAHQYDNLGNLTRVTRDSGGSTERVVDYAYDGLNRVRTETQYAGPGVFDNPLVMTTTYDANSNRATVIDQLSRTTTFSYDRLNRLIGIAYSDSVTPGASYTYDANGSRLTMTDGTGQTTYTYDALGRLLSVMSPATPSNKTVAYRYDRDGNRTKLVYPGGDAVTYTFDKASRLTSLSDWLTPTPRQVSYTYYPDSAVQTQTNPNGTVAAYSYDNARRLTEVWNKPSLSATDAITRHQFTIDAVGNRTQVAETLAPILPPPLQPPPSGLPSGHGGTASTVPSGLPSVHGGTASTVPSGLPNRPGPNTSPTTQTLTYGYDKLHRLTSAAGGPAGSTTYSYDPVGNRLTRTRSSVTTTYAYDRADRITSATTPSSGTSYTVNPVGNMTGRGSDMLTYDQANRLTGIDFSSSSTPDVSSIYDGDGKRASKVVGSTTTSYVYDVSRGLPVLLEDGTRRYIWGLGLAYEVEGGAALVYHVDGLSSVRAITDVTKAIVQVYESDEFGIPLSTQGGSSQPFGFTGEQRDSEASIVYLRARMYDPQIGRFVQRDTLPGMSITPQSLNRYAYTRNDPVNQIDRSGTYSYRYDWDLGPASTVGSPETVMSYFQQHPREIFPFGLGECDKIVLRSECGLQTGPYYQLAGQPANIVISNVTATTFTFTAIAGHFDYNPDFPDSGQITFRIYQGAGRIFLQQKARAIPVWGTPNGPAAGWPVHSQSRIGPLGDALDAGVPYVALSEWATQWQNLRRIFNPNND